MKRWMAFLAATLMLFGCACADSIKVTGSATVTASPDCAVIHVGAEYLCEDVSQAQEQLNGTIAAVLAALEGGEFALTEGDIQTESYYINTEYRYNYETDESIQAGYRAGCILSVCVNDTEMAGRVIDAAFGAGANRMNGIEFRLRDATEVNDQALTLAIDDALRKARLIASASGISLDGLSVNVDTTGGYYADNGRMYAMAEDKAMGASVRSGLLSYTATVTVTYSPAN